MFFDIGKDDFNGLTPQAIHRFRLSGLHPDTVGLDQLFMFATLHTAPASLTRRTLKPQRASLTGLRLAPVLPFHDLASATA
jgi:hypothetical protein